MYGSCRVEVFCRRHMHLCSGFSFFSFTHVAFDHLMHLCSAPCPCRCVYICLSHIISKDQTQQNQANMGRRELRRGGIFFVPLLWKALGSLSSLKRTGCSWCFLGKGKGKNREESSGLSSVAPHYFRGDSPPSFFVQQFWALWCDWSSNRPGNANNPKFWRRPVTWLLGRYEEAGLACHIKGRIWVATGLS